MDDARKEQFISEYRRAVYRDGKAMPELSQEETAGFFLFAFGGAAVEKAEEAAQSDAYEKGIGFWDAVRGLLLEKKKEKSAKVEKSEALALRIKAAQRSVEALQASMRALAFMKRCADEEETFALQGEEIGQAYILEVVAKGGEQGRIFLCEAEVGGERRVPFALESGASRQEGLECDFRTVVEYLFYAPKMSFFDKKSLIKSADTMMWDQSDFAFACKIIDACPGDGLLAGEELDARVAKEIIGFKLFRATLGKQARFGESIAKSGVWIDEEREEPRMGVHGQIADYYPVVRPIPKYSEDIGEALKAAQILKGTAMEEDFNKELRALQKDEFSLCAVTPLHICLAALAAAEKEAERKRHECELEEFLETVE